MSKIKTMLTFAVFETRAGTDASDLNAVLSELVSAEFSEEDVKTGAVARFLKTYTDKGFFVGNINLTEAKDDDESP